MKYISKGQEPMVLSQYKAGANDEWEPTFNGLPGKKKRELHRHLIREQGWICCYCLRRIDERSSHIEHLHPQSKPPDLSLAYRNLLASCQLNLQPTEPRHCGMLKGNWYDENTMVSPLEKDCENRFRFTANGDIVPAAKNDRGARVTIKKLGLDIDHLCAIRRNAIDGALAAIDELSSEDIRKLANGFLERDSQGQFPVCCQAVAHVLMGLA